MQMRKKGKRGDGREKRNTDESKERDWRMRGERGEMDESKKR